MDSNRPVATIMTRHPVTIEPDTPINRIHDLFEQHPFHHIPVLDKAKLVGIISKTDYLKIRHMISITWGGVTICQEMYQDICAADIMTEEPIYIESDDPISLAATIFRENTLHALPVVDKEELVGIVTSHDLLTYAYHQ